MIGQVAGKKEALQQPAGYVTGGHPYIDTASRPFIGAYSASVFGVDITTISAQQVKEENWRASPSSLVSDWLYVYLDRSGNVWADLIAPVSTLPNWQGRRHPNRQEIYIGCFYIDGTGNPITAYSNGESPWEDHVFGGDVTILGDLTVGTTPTLFVDVSLNRIGVGTSSPDFNLHILGSSFAGQVIESVAGNDAFVEFRENSTVRFKLGFDDSDNVFKIAKSDFGADNFTVNYATGNVGIGTSSPDEQLSLTDSIKLLQDNADEWALGNVAGVNRLRYDGGNDDFGFFGTDNQPRVTLEMDTGHLGIGTSSPDGTLHVHTATAGTVTANVGADDLVIENSGNGGLSILTPDANTATIYLGSPTDSAGALITWRHDSNLMSIGTANAGDSLRFLTDNGTERMRILSTGNVGIGVNNPGDLLSIYAPGGVAKDFFRVRDTTDTVDLVLHYDGDNFRFQSEGSGTGKNYLTFQNSTGHLGIGTSSPGFPLTVKSSDVNPFTTQTSDFDGGSNIGSCFFVTFGATTGNTYTSLRALSSGYSAWNNLILQSGGGNVGIGTVTPDELFSVGDKFLVDTNGLTYWKGNDSSGLPYGSMYTNTTIAVTVSVANTAYEVGNTWTSGEVNDMTFGASHYLVATKAGRYKIDWAMTCSQSSPSSAINWEGGIMINGAAVTGPGRAMRTISNSTDTGAAAGTAILDLAASAQISLYIKNETNTTNIDVEHANVTAVMVGGT